MGNIFQTSGFQIQDSEASQLLHVFPLTLDVGETPTLLYRLDEDLKVGSTVSYRLVAGFRILNWKGIVFSVQGNSWTDSLKQGPFSLFNAKHSIHQENGTWECTDEIFFNGEMPEISAVMEQARVVFAFKARSAFVRAKDTYETRHKTEIFKAFNSGFSAG